MDGSVYAGLIRGVLRGSQKYGPRNVRHIEAWMRMSRATLDGLSLVAFAGEVESARAAAKYAGADESERIARSLGL